ncbi:MAG: hypothetical protein JKY02_08825 [Flavobacteriaceae bacterium]|nr:hypothetical protein [Flavobacteriaceae bacterium]
MKTIIIAIAAVFLVQCKSAQFEAKPPVTITGATFNNWVGGQPGVSGIRVIIAYKQQENIEFQKIYFAEKEGKIETYQKKGKTYLVGYIDTSSREKEDLVLDRDPKKEMNNKLPKADFPFQLKENEAVISYLKNGKTKFFKVEKIKQTKTDFYP